MKYTTKPVNYYWATIGYASDVIQWPTLSVSLPQHAKQGLLCPLPRVNLLKVQSAGLVGLDDVKGPKNQTFHLQLVDAVQL